MCSGCTERLVTTAQMARQLGLSRDEVEALTAEPGFPPVLTEVESSSPPYVRRPLWRWSDVRRWLAAT